MNEYRQLDNIMYHIGLYLPYIVQEMIVSRKGLQTHMADLTL